jgi:hypothetical protein
MNNGENTVKWIKGQSIIWFGHPERMEDDRMPKKIFTQELEGMRQRGRPTKEWKEEEERDLQVLGVRRWRELLTQEKMEGYCSTGQSPQQAVVPMEEEVHARTQLTSISLCTFSSSMESLWISL